MAVFSNKKRILILGASGFIGQAIYKELAPYFKTFGTYFTATLPFKDNQHYAHYNMETDSVFELLDHLKPQVVVLALRGNFNAQTQAHQHVIAYAKHYGTSLIFLSSANVFDAYSKFPSYEYDKTLSYSTYGHFKIKIENALMRLPKHQWTILRLPMVFGTNSPRLNTIKQLIKNNDAIEVFPNLITNVTTANKLTQQVHYIINQNLSGIYHLGSTDLVHHNDFISALVNTLTQKPVKYKQVFTTNTERYLAALPKYNELPKHLLLQSHSVLMAHKP